MVYGKKNIDILINQNLLIILIIFTELIKNLLKQFSIHYVSLY